MEISIAPEIITRLGSISVTNSLVSVFLVVASIVIFILFSAPSFSAFKPKKVQIVLEFIIDYLYSSAKDIIGKPMPKIFPFLLTFFVFIVPSNFFGLLPIVGPIGVMHHPEKIEGAVNWGHCFTEKNCYLTLQGTVEMAEAVTPLFRAPTADVSATIALALISVVATNVLGFSYVGFKYIGKYFNFSNLINFFIGILELISEIGKILSFTFRLFGNIFAGEVLLVVVTSLSMGLATLPFLGLEIFVGFIQGFVFFMLTTVFVGMSIHHEH